MSLITASLAVDIADDKVLVCVCISPSTFVMAAIIELRFAAANEGVVVKLLFKIPLETREV